jgi:hypothetical protein
MLQLSGSEPVSMHWPEQFSVPVGQELVQVPPQQANPSAHACPQIPQLRGLEDVLTHSPPHREKPALHSTPHCPPEHVAEPFGIVGQTFPQLPQLRGSVAKSAH